MEALLEILHPSVFDYLSHIMHQESAMTKQQSSSAGNDSDEENIEWVDNDHRLATFEKETPLLDSLASNDYSQVTL